MFYVGWRLKTSLVKAKEKNGDSLCFEAIQVAIVVKQKRDKLLGTA